MSDYPSFFGVEPSLQNALDLFKGEWSTRLPDQTGLVASTGPVRACEDYRINWFEKQVGGFAGKRVLELGPLEAGHTYMLERAGAAGITSIEANPRAYLKCLVMKEVFALQRVKFLLGDFLPYLRTTTDRFDLGIASGVLYHLLNPVELLQLLAPRCDSVFLWTHCYDSTYMAAHPDVGRYFDPEPQISSVGGFTHHLYRKRYGEALQWKGFCGGGAIDSCWLTQSDILGALQHLGYRVINLLEETKNPNGPSLLVAATRT